MTNLITVLQLIVKSQMSSLSPNCHPLFLSQPKVYLHRYIDRIFSTYVGSVTPLSSAIKSNPCLSPFQIPSPLMMSLAASSRNPIMVLTLEMWSIWSRRCLLSWARRRRKEPYWRPLRILSVN